MPFFPLQSQHPSQALHQHHLSASMRIEAEVHFGPLLRLRSGAKGEVMEGLEFYSHGRSHDDDDDGFMTLYDNLWS